MEHYGHTPETIYKYDYWMLDFTPIKTLPVESWNNPYQLRAVFDNASTQYLRAKYGSLSAPVFRLLIAENSVRYMHFKHLHINFFTNWIIVSILVIEDNEVVPISIFHSPFMEEITITSYFLKLCVEFMATCLTTTIVTNKPSMCKRLWLVVHDGDCRDRVVFIPSCDEICLLLKSVLPTKFCFHLPTSVLNILIKNVEYSDAHRELILLMDNPKSQLSLSALERDDVLLKVSEWYELCNGTMRDRSLSSSDISKFSLLQDLMSSEDFSKCINHINVACLPV